MATLSNDLTPYGGTWGETQVRHLLKRAMFGVPIDQMVAATALGSMDALLTTLLDTSAPLPAMPGAWANEYLAPNPNIPDPKQLDLDTHNKANHEAARSQQVRNWWLDQMLQANLNMRERMAYMWSNHFVTGTGVVQHAGYMYQYTQTLRTFALGNLKDFARAISIDPAMLLYLNGNQNYAGQDPLGNLVGEHVNENFARELMELFLLGRLNPINGAANYTEDDIRNSGKALTGWQPTTTAPFVGQFQPQCHDTTAKTFLGQTGNYGLDDILAIIFSQSNGYSVAYFICQKIYLNFVYWVPNPTVIDAMAKLLIQSNWEIKPVMRALLSSAHFYDPTLIGAHIKSPTGWLCSMIREFEIAYPAFVSTDPVVTSTDANGYDVYGDPNPTLTFLASKVGVALGEEILNPPNVKGWPIGEDWISTKSYQDRKYFATQFLTYPGPYDGSATANFATLTFKADVWMQSWPNAANTLITPLSVAIETHLFGLPPGPIEVQGLWKVVNELQLPDAFWHFSYDYGARYAQAVGTFPQFQLV